MGPGHFIGSTWHPGEVTAESSSGRRAGYPAGGSGEKGVAAATQDAA